MPSWPTLAGSDRTSSALGLGRSFHEFVVADRGNDGAYVPRCADARSGFARGAAGRHGVGAERFRHGAYYSAVVGASDSLGAGTVASDLLCDQSTAEFYVGQTILCQWISFVLDEGFVQFGGHTYKQSSGIFMGTAPAPDLANDFAFMHELEFLKVMIDGYVHALSLIHI